MTPNISVLINLYNYGQFIAEAIDSVLAQKHPADEIIIVDDGSTDEGPQIVEEYASKHTNLKLLRKENGGQLSCFEQGFEASSGDIVLFLDADDVWEPSHLANISRAFQENPDVDLIFTEYRKFGTANDRHTPYSKSIHLGQNIISTLFSRKYYGSITSANAFRRQALIPLFPVTSEVRTLCRINADAWLVFGLSIFGGNSYYLSSDTVRYRIHGDNNYQNSDKNIAKRFDEVLLQRRIIEQLRVKADIPFSIKYEFHHEFETKPSPSKRCYKQALNSLSLLNLSMIKGFKMRQRIARHYRKFGTP
ncbi:MAG TPA: hypothetical protein DCX06_13605 [Opitutae bacterium]|nr:hypothetical protein [Opitutae bacterium]